MLTWEILEEIAIKAGHQPATVYRWKARQHIPYKPRGKFIDLAQKQGINVRFEDFDRIAWPPIKKQEPSFKKELAERLEAIEAMLRKLTPP
jgi:hypothetical protein